MENIELKDTLCKLERELEKTCQSRTKKMAELENLLGERGAEFEQELKKSEIKAYEQRIDKLQAEIAQLRAQI